MTHERTMESEPIPPPTVTTNQNYNIHDDGVEDISNDGIDPPLSSTNFIHGYPIDNTMMMQSPSPVNVPSYSYLLKHSSSSISSDSDDENDDNNNNIEKPMNNMSLHECDHTKRGLQSSSNSDASPVKKKAKIALKRRLPRSSSSSSSSDDATVSSTVTTRQNNSVVVKQPSPLPQQKPAVSPPPPPARIQIQRSSSSSSSSSPASSDDGSNGSDEILTKRTRQRRKKPVSNERSKILKQIQRKTEEKKNATTTTATTISPANDSDSQNDSGTKMTTTNGTRSKFQFSDEDDGETTESYEVEKNNDDDDDKEKSDDDDDDDDDTQEGKSPSRRKKGASGRKNIRKILDDKELDVQTQQAVEAERERRRRIDEKQKEYNDTLLQQSSFLTNIAEETTTNTNRGLVLEMDKTTNEPLIEVAPRLVEHLKPHQSDGIRFLWNNVYESIDAIQNKKHSSNGCILAHCMGLGKTLQVISLIHTVFNYEKLTKARTCLILCPINAALNWSMEFDFWLKDVEPEIDIYQMATIKANLRISHLNYWHEHGGVIIMGYDMYRRLANGLGLKNKKLKAQAFKCLVDPGPDVVVADEGHILKNAQTALAKCLTKIQTSRRIVLTGTPLQNNLIEYYCMVSFVKPNLLGSQQEYINRFVNPIQNGQHRDSSMDDVRLMKRRACVLHELLTGCVDRKDYSLLKDYLPPKFEYIINVRMSDLQSILYEMYLKRQATGGGIETNQDQQVLSLATSTLKKDFKSAKLFSDYQFLQKIWTHPFLLYPHFIDRWKKRMHEEDDDMIDDGDIEAIFSDEEQEMEELKKKNGKTKKTKKSEEKKKKNGCGFLIDNVDDEPIVVEEIAAGDVQMKSNERRASSDGSTTTIGSDSLDNDDDDDDDIEEIGPDEKEETDEIIKSYTTRSRTAAAKTLQKQQTNPSMKRKPMDVDVFDTGNDAAGSDQQNEGEKNEAGEAEEEPPWMDEMREQFWFPLLDGLPAESEFDMQLGGKFLLLKAILDKCAEIGDKLILFSRSLYALNYIERFLHNLQKLNEREYLQQCESRRKLREILASTASSSATSNGNEHEEFIPEPVEWVRDHDYFRMDGQTDVTARKRYARAFNDMSNIKARLFLISTLAGGIGINLVGSNRVIVFDASWNPSHDTQAIFRSYRFGQKKPVYIYRFLARGTMEEKIYQRQVVKQSLSQRVVDDHQLDRHFTENDIKELYKFTPESLPPARSPSALLTESNTEFNYAIPKDHLLLDLLYEHGRWIHSYHSHDSLLENKLEEGLSADERRTALEEYENLKRLPDQRQLAVQRMQQQQQLNALIAQQQYLASAATTVQQQVPEAQQLYLQFLEGLTPADRRAFDYSKMLQYAFQLGLMPESNNGSPTTAAPPKTSKRRAQKSTMSAPPKPSTSMTADSSTTASNDVILLESDHDDDAIDDDNEPIDNNNNNHHHP